VTAGAAMQALRPTQNDPIAQFYFLHDVTRQEGLTIGVDFKGTPGTRSPNN